ncbi:hypothetical protein [Actinomycetospora lemnae]|uniref:Uncharacterized protein n=1 Tax=Actinomycetospora lemnae TaxID=3019891 RepID=A0ABT5SY27_9PSEU|nr:hypothetical protein [Actinomycetospora sp. DW7H6]MDD7967689.1 hypothetical protein [Actinomycetospora sp. DW7H6]
MSRALTPVAALHHGGTVTRNLLTGAITVDDLPAATAAFIRTQGAKRGLDGDPLDGVTHGLRTDEDTHERLSSGPRVEHHTTEMLLGPTLLVIAYRQGHDDRYDRVDPAARVSFHRLDQLELVDPPAEKRGRTLGADAQGVLSLASRPVGGPPRRATRHIPTGNAPEAASFREALAAAVERARASA